MGAIIITIIIAILATVAAIFAVLFFQDRKDSQKYESKADSLNKEVNILRCELARRENAGGDATTTLTKENIAEFLKREKTGDVEVSEDNWIIFKVNGEQYYFDCTRLPRQLILGKVYGGMSVADIHWDILEQAAVEISKDLVMIKVNIKANEGYDFTIVSTTRTVMGLREDFDFFISLIAEADIKMPEVYWEIMKNTHPEECENEKEVEQFNVEDMAVRMAQETGYQKKIQS